MWHSDVPSRLRRETWRGVATGEVRVVVGARSALFLPFADLGLIVVDEEHDASFKQDDGVCYHARDMAVVRASLEDIPVVLSSARPRWRPWSTSIAGATANSCWPAAMAARRCPRSRPST